MGCAHVLTVGAAGKAYRSSTSHSWPEPYLTMRPMLLKRSALESEVDACNTIMARQPDTDKMNYWSFPEQPSLIQWVLVSVCASATHVSR